MSNTEATNGPEPVKHGFQNFEFAAADIVLAASFNSAGNRAIICSADHKIRVYNIDGNSAWGLADVWRGHDAEVLDVQWIAPSLGPFFATIGGDNKFKIWREEPSQLYKSGRRFRCIYSQSAPNRGSYVSFGTKTINHSIFLATLTHDGLLSLLQPEDSESESLTSWSQKDSIYPFGSHPRGTEARFRLSIQQSEGPTSNALFAGIDINALSLAVSAMNSIKIYRAFRQSGNYQFYEMHDMHTDTALINDIAWAPGCLRPYDVIATACDDGTVRVFRVDTPYDSDGSSRAPVAKSLQPTGPPRKASVTARNTPSGIGAGLAGMSRTSAPRRDMVNEVKHESRQIAILEHEDKQPVWKLRWFHDGSTLASTGDSGKVYMWRENIRGNFVEFAETEAA